MEHQNLPIVETDEWLRPVAAEIEYRNQLYLDRLHQIEHSCGSLYDFANAHLYYGVQRDDLNQGWWIREWLPSAKHVTVFGDWNEWDREQYSLTKDAWGCWSLFLSDKQTNSKLSHGSMIKLHIHGADDSRLDRISAYIRRAVQDPDTKDFCGQVWHQPDFDWSDDLFQFNAITNPIIYETHIGMSSEQESVSTYIEFTERLIPYIKSLGYNTIQFMAIAEHPYYGSFGYHVSSLFAPSSRFGTPEELKELIKTAHKNGLGVIMDLVHSHYVKNIAEGLNRIDGTDYTYSPEGEQGDHIHWDSKLYDYAKHEVQHLLLSNVKYWLEEFHFDGYRFDGVSSMIYSHHGYIDFGSYDSYFGDEVNRNALTYLTLANRLIHEVRPDALSIAEEVSGMPTITAAIADGGIGFDYRLAMAIPDFWIKYLKDTPDEQWNLEQMWSMMNNRTHNTKTIAYSESHDQALVGDNTIAFRLMDKEMYCNMSKDSSSPVVDRGIALHKMIRLFTITLGGEGYMNFMGNEFGHPEWVDFPRDGNDWSYNYARRQWSLSHDTTLRYIDLLSFDIAMIKLINKYHILSAGYGYKLLCDEQNKSIAFEQASLIFLFNWHTQNSIMDYKVPVPIAGKYCLILNSDEPQFGGFSRLDSQTQYFTTTEDGKHYLQVYNINRSVLVFELCT